MLIIADTSALVALARGDALRFLDGVFSAVRVPPAVFRECVVPGKREAEQLKKYLEGRVVEVDLSQVVISVSGLGEGELEAIALYKRLDAGFLLLDDHRARRAALVNGVRVVGSLGVLLAAKERGLITEIRPLLRGCRTSRRRGRLTKKARDPLQRRRSCAST